MRKANGGGVMGCGETTELPRLQLLALLLVLPIGGGCTGAAGGAWMKSGRRMGMGTGGGGGGSTGGEGPIAPS
jgi:hypothetical protein